MIKENQKILVIKHSENSFEKFINDKIASYKIDILPSEIFGFKEKNLFRRYVNIYRAIKQVNCFNQYDKIIVFDVIDVLKVLLLFVSRKKIHLWLWNTVSKRKYWDIYLLKNIVKISTFDETDAKRFGILNNTQFYFPIQIECNSKHKKIFFVGADKGRGQLLEELYDWFTSYNCVCDFHILTNDIRNDFRGIYTQEFMDYNNVINHISSSDVIVDIKKENQSGLTLRALEAAFLNKKIVTNNINIRNTLFYDPDLVFILGVDDKDKMNEFLANKEKVYDAKATDYYSFESWLSRLIKMST